MLLSVLPAQPNPVMLCLFLGFGSGSEVRVDLNDFRAYVSLGRVFLRVFSSLRQPSLHTDKRLAEATAGRHFQNKPSRMADQPAAQVHHPLHDGAQPTTCRLLQPDDPGVEHRLAQHAEHVVHQDPELEKQLVDAELSGRQALQVEFAFQFREVLLARAPVAVQTQDVGIGYLLQTCPDAEDLVLRQEQGLPLFAGPFGHLVDQSDSSDFFAVPAGASRVNGLAGPGRMDLSFLHGQVDQNLGLFSAQIVASDETVPGLEPCRHECPIIEGRVVHPEQTGIGQLAHPRTNPGMEVQGPFMQGVMAPWTKLGSNNQTAFEERADRGVAENPGVALGDALLLGVAVVEDGGVGVDPHANKVRHSDDPGLEIQLAQHAHRAHGHGFMDVAIKAHGLETLAQSGLRRHTTNPQGCRKELTVLELPHVVETHLAYSDKAAKAPQDVLFSDLMVRGLPLGADGIYVADAHEFAHRCKPGIADDRFLGDLKGQLSHVVHLAGEKTFVQSCEVNMPKYLIYFNTRLHRESKSH
jgi:hypothetical protein